MRTPGSLTNEWLDERWMPRFASASYDERCGLLRALHGIHEGFKREGLVAVTHAALDDSERLIRQVEEEETQYLDPEYARQLLEPTPVEFEPAYERLEAQAEAEMQPA